MITAARSLPAKVPLHVDLKTASALHRLRLISLPEAISFPILLVCSVLKRTTSFDGVMVMGMVHGILFTLYVLFWLDAWNRTKWSAKTGVALLRARRAALRRLLRRAQDPARAGRRGDRHPGPQGRRGQRMIVAFSVSPLGVGEDVGEYVADAVRVVRESGLPNRTDAMFTSIEGEWDEVMDVVKRAVAAVEARSNRVSLVLKADIRPGVTDGLTSKVETVERHLSAE